MKRGAIETTVVDTPTRQYGDEKVVEATFGIPAKTLQKFRWAKTGPPYRKIGKRVLYDLSEVRMWVDSRKVNPSR